MIIRTSMALNRFLLCLAMGLAAGCSLGDTQTTFTPTPGSCNNRTSVYATPTGIPSYCSTTTSYSSPVTITGSATYTARDIDSSGASPGLLGPKTPAPIRHAEIRVTNSSGAVVQCGETDASGDFSLALPSGGQSYTITINARADNSFVKATVFQCPEEATIHSISTTVTADSSKSVGTINAPYNGSLEGGAFNILDQILYTNEKLRTDVGSCSQPGCTSFSVAPMVKVYWEPGFSNAAYAGGTVSFFTVNPADSTDRRLFIVGGVDGDTDSNDTDHFDNTIIIHEYGHFLEDVYTIADSPGGAHFGTDLIDPRLAWSEGWANFLQAYIQDDPYYIDTFGNIDGTTGFGIRFALENQTGSGSTDAPNLANEGNFREFSVARILWDMVDSGVGSLDGGADTIDGLFEEIWASMTTTDGLANPNAAFQSTGLFHLSQQNALTSPTDISSLRTLEKHSGDRSEYAQYVIQQGTECVSGGSDMDYTISPTLVTNDGSANAYLVNSHFVNNYNFYQYYHSGGTLAITLTHQTQSGSSEADLDLIVYEDLSRLNVVDSFGRYSLSPDIVNNLSAGEGATSTDSTVGTAETESVSFTLAAGDYLIGVAADVATTGGAGVGVDTFYKLQIGANYLCPTAIP